MIKTLEAKVQKEVLINFIFVSAVVISIFVVFQIVSLTNTMFSTGMMFFEAAASFFTFTIFCFIISVPLNLMISILLAAVRMHNDSELVIVLMTGRTKNTLLLMLSKLILGILIMQCLLIFFVIPFFLKISLKKMFNINEITVIFNKLKTTDRTDKLAGNQLSFVSHEFDGEQVKNIFLLRNKGEMIDYFFIGSAKIYGEELLFDKIKFVSFKEGRLHREGRAESIEISPKNIQPQIRISLLTQAKDIISLYKEEDGFSVYEFHFRINQIFSLIIGVFIALTLINFKPRQKNVNLVFLWAVAIYLVYFAIDSSLLSNIKKDQVIWKVYLYKGVILSLFGYILFKKPKRCII